MTSRQENLETWDVQVGHTARDFINGIDFLDSEDRRQAVLEESVRILSRCSDPMKPVSRTCLLVLGDVQSGKTLSFTTVTALSRDNGLPLTIVLAGTKKPLMRQTFEQLRNDLTRSSSGAAKQWVITPSLNNEAEVVIERALNTWLDEQVPRQFRQAVVIVAMKTPAGIKKVTKFISKLQQTIGREFPVLVIDDEGDQASPNTLHLNDDYSATYTAISNLRDALPNHSFLSYTATPEANVLLALNDHLSPQGVIVLKPGDGYVGGYKLFVDRSFSRKFRLEVPDNELDVAQKPDLNDSPPLSLQSALAYFLVVLAVAQTPPRSVRPVSMLIHPHQTIAVHKKYNKWVRSIINKWILHFSENSLDDRLYRPPREFIQAINELRKTLPDLEELFGTSRETETNKKLLELIRFWINSENLEVRIVNSERASHKVTPREWASKAAWILIGAGTLERGFVVKNLAVTYMPRGIGGGNIDTIQQRARFFGYKAHYMDLLRGWFSKELADTYATIFDTESALREQLKKYDTNNLNLAGWKRTMIMDPSLRPTRPSVMSLSNSMSKFYGGAWYQQKDLFEPTLSTRARDLTPVLEKMMMNAEETPLDTRLREEFKHKVSSLTLPNTVEFLLAWPMTATDKKNLTMHVIVLASLAETQSNTHVELFFMNQLQARRRRVAQPSKDAYPNNRNLWRIENLHEGPRTKSKPPYLGDRSIRSDEAISIQIHRVLPYDADGSPNHDGEPCFAIALAWPEGFEIKVLQQITS